MAVIAENQSGAFESLLREIEIAENKLSSLNSGEGKQQDVSEDGGAGVSVAYLEEEINQLRSEFDRRREEMDSRSSLEDTEERVSDEDDGDEIDLGDQDPELSQR